MIVFETKEVKNITVADSVAYLEKEGAEMLEGSEQKVKEKQADYEKDSIEDKYPSIINMKLEWLNDAKANYDNDLAIVDGWKNLYKNRDPKEVLRVVVECKYSIINPLLKAKQEATGTYLMSPDGKICYGEM